MKRWCLIVDDNSVNLMIMENMLKDYEIEVDQALSGMEAISMAGEREYDIVFMDYLMPQMNGVETTREIRKWDKGKKAAVIALTANVTEEITEEFLSAGANEVVEKPLNKDSLDSLMGKWIPYVGSMSGEGEKGQDEKQEKNIGWLREKLKEIFMDLEEGAFFLSDDVTVVYRILFTSLQNINDALWHLHELEGMSMWLDMGLYFHSIKGILANLGVRGLSARCGELENLAAKKDEEKVRDMASPLLQDMDWFAGKLQEVLKEWKQEGESQGVSVHAMDREEWLDTLEELKGFLKCYEINYVEEYFQKLLSSAEGEESRIIRRASQEMQDFQYENALEILEGIS